MRCVSSLRSGRCRTYVRGAIDVKEPGLGVKQRKGKKRGCSDVKLHENQPASSWLFASRAVRGDCLIGVEIAAEFFQNFGAATLRLRAYTLGSFCYR